MTSMLAGLHTVALTRLRIHEPLKRAIAREAYRIMENDALGVERHLRAVA